MSHLENNTDFFDIEENLRSSCPHPTKLIKYTEHSYFLFSPHPLFSFSLSNNIPIMLKVGTYLHSRMNHKLRVIVQPNNLKNKD
jgi:hypothetical protein